MPVQEPLARNLDAVLERVRRASAESGRAPADVRLCAVTKSVPSAVALELAALGQRDLGENRLSSLEEKSAAFAAAGEEVRWHYIGHIQRNKARRVLGLATVIHSVDSLRLADALARMAQEESLEREAFVQVKLSGEEEKHGVAPHEIESAARLLAQCPRFSLLGLMTMGPRPTLGPDGQLETDHDATRRVFAQLAELASKLDPALFKDGAPQLSMGMSGDFEVAIEQGAHWVRVGSALFEGLDSGSAKPEAVL